MPDGFLARGCGVDRLEWQGDFDEFLAMVHSAKS